MLGIECSGKTMFSSCIFDGQVSEYTPTTGYAETDVTYHSRSILLIEFGGSISHSWHKLFKHYKRRATISCLLLFVDGSFGEAQLERTRCHLMCMYYYFNELRLKPLCVVQHNASADNVPQLSWETIKDKLQLDLLVGGNYCESTIVVIRLVYDEPNALTKNMHRILEWIISNKK